MATLLEHLGGLLDRWRGRSKTIRERRNIKHASQFVRLEDADGFHITVTSRRHVFRTYYEKGWPSSRRQSVYEVVGSVPEDTPEEVLARLDPRLFVPVTYPCLCTRLLEWSHYPHLKAINAFMDQIPQYGGDTTAASLLA